MILTSMRIGRSPFGSHFFRKRTKAPPDPKASSSGSARATPAPAPSRKRRARASNCAARAAGSEVEGSRGAQSGGGVQSLSVSPSSEAVDEDSAEESSSSDMLEVEKTLVKSESSPHTRLT